MAAAGEVARNTLTAEPSAEAIRRDRIEEMSSGHAHLELHPVPRLAVIERHLAATGDGMCAGLEVKIGHCAHRFNDVDDGRETDAAGAATTRFLISVLGISASSGRRRPCRVLPFWRRETSRDCAIWTRLGGRQKLTNCNSSCDLVGLMSGRNERMSSDEKPADCVASPVSPKAEGSTDALKDSGGDVAPRVRRASFARRRLSAQ